MAKSGNSRVEYKLLAFDGVLLRLVPTTRSLGMILVASLTMEVQVTSIASRAFSQFRQALQQCPVSLTLI